MQTEQATIEQKNRAIAGFMELEKQYSGGFIPIAEVRYHASWDWLMPVIKKIRSMNVLILPLGVAEGWVNAASKMNKGLITIDIETAHQGVFDFIQGYNQQSPTTK